VSFATWSIRKPIPSILFFIIFTLLGWLFFSSLPVQDTPDFDLPTITVAVSLPGATASSMETEVARKVEDAVVSLGSVKHVYSTLSEGSASVTVEFELEKNPQDALTDVTDAVSQIRSQLPSDISSPVVTKMTTAGSAISTYAISVEGLSTGELSWFVDNTLSKALMGISGVSKVTRQGGVDREIQIRLDPRKMLALGLTSAEVSQKLAALQQDAPAGRGDLSGQEQSIRVKGTATTSETLKDYVLSFAGGQHVRLSELAEVRDGPAEQRQFAQLDGKPVVSVQVYRTQGYSEVTVQDNVSRAIRTLEAATPGMKSVLIVDRVSRVKDQYQVSMQSLWEGSLLAVVVVFLFLRDFRATAIAAVALPLSIVPTFYLMHLMGFSLNTVTLLALTLIVGVLVDDAIVEIENIVRHLNMGKTPFQAACDAATEIGLAVVATTATLVAVFLPTAFMGGIPGKFFKQFGWTAALAVLVSLLVARFLTPMMAAYWLKPLPHVEPKDGWVMTRYLALLDKALLHPGKVLLMAFIFFLGSLGLAAHLPSGFLPAGNRDSTLVNVELAPGSSAYETLALSERARSLIQGTEGVTTVYTSIGAGSEGNLRQAGATAEVRTATLTVNLLPQKQRRASAEIEKELRVRLAQLPGARVTVGSGMSGERFSMVLTGDDASLLDQAATNVVSELRGVPGLGSVSTSASLQRPELVIKPDFDRMAQLGVSTQSLAQVVRVATTGDYNTALPKLNLPERQLYVRVQLATTQRQDLDLIRQLRVPAREGTVPLSSVALISLESGPVQIARQDRSRNVTITAELAGLPLGDISEKVKAFSSVQNLPAGVAQKPSGEGERMAELFSSFGLAMGLGIFCVYAVMVLLFHAFGQPFTILSALPLSVGGAFGALLLGGYSLSLPSLIGFIMLMGIVTKNSILLVEYAQMSLMERGLDRTAAIRDACHKRARPIVMTTIAMVAGMLPLALGLHGGDSSFRAPMAYAVIGGLVTSTMLSLFVVPVVFEVVDELTLRISRLLRKDTPDSV
jgi:multidrug efflux pump subunit AcrB